MVRSGNKIKEGKVHKILDPLPLQDGLNCFEFKKKLKFDDTPPLDLIWKNFELESFEFWETPWGEKYISLKHLKLPKN